MTFRIGVLGAGTHGTRYLRHALKDVPGMTATALMRRRPEKGQALARELGVRYHATAAELVQDPLVDGIVISTPPSSHHELATLVLNAGKPLLLEKPFTGTLAEAEDLTLHPQAGQMMVAQTLRWNPVLVRVRELWAKLGKVHHIRAAQRLEPTRLAWQKNPGETVTGSVLLTGVHIFDTVRFLTGREFREVVARQQSILNPVVEDFFLARASLDDGCWVSMEVSKYTRSRACWLEAVGEEGQLWADYLNGGIVWRQGADEERFDVSARVPTLPRVLADWQAAVLSEKPCPVTARDGVATMQVVDACYRSAEQEKVAFIAR
nr:Gfo/Idh/MocA family oxidoreductase [Candidatus Krumholzibacteria bacterium]